MNPCFDRASRARRARSFRVSLEAAMACRTVKPLLAAIAVALVVVAPFTSGAQPTGRVLKIGILEPFHAAVRANLIEAFRQGLRQLGYEERRNYVIEARFADGKLDR